MPNSEKDILTSFPNPYRRKTYTVSVTQDVTIGRRAYQFVVRYIPDKLLLDNQGLNSYLRQREAGRAETLAHDIMEDIMDQIIPKWIEVNLRQKHNKFGQNIRVTMTDRQPGWEDDAFLNRLPPVFIGG